MATIKGHIERVEHRVETGWYAVMTDHDSVKKLETKKSDLAEQAAELKRSGVLCEIEFTERESTNTNPHTGKPYMNRYYEGAKPLVRETEQAAVSGIDVVTETSRKTNPGDAWRICLAAGGKLAVATLPMMPVAQRSFEVQKQIATAWAEFFYFSVAPESASFATGSNGSSGLEASSFQAPTPGGAGRSGPGAYDEPLGVSTASDDDIPF